MKLMPCYRILYSSDARSAMFARKPPPPPSSAAVQESMAATLMSFFFETFVPNDLDTREEALHALRRWFGIATATLAAIFILHVRRPPVALGTLAQPVCALPSPPGLRQTAVLDSSCRRCLCASACCSAARGSTARRPGSA